MNDIDYNELIFSPCPASEGIMGIEPAEKLPVDTIPVDSIDDLPPDLAGTAPQKTNRLKRILLIVVGLNVLCAVVCVVIFFVTGGLSLLNPGRIVMGTAAIRGQAPAPAEISNSQTDPGAANRRTHPAASRYAHPDRDHHPLPRHRHPRRCPSPQAACLRMSASKRFVIGVPGRRLGPGGDP